MFRLLTAVAALAVCLSPLPAQAADGGVTPQGGGLIVNGSNGAFTFVGFVTPLGVLVGDGVVTLTDATHFTAVATLEAPDGSRLYVTTAGTFAHDYTAYTETITIRGGTGRFKKASGTVEIEGTVWPGGIQIDTVVGGHVRLR